MKYNPGWGGKIRELRKMKGLTQMELSKKVGLHWKFIGEVERGDSDIKLGNIARIAKGLGMELNEILAYCFPKTVRSREEEEVIGLLKKLSWKEDKKKLQKVKVFIEEVLE
ncbi:MAG: helix-turn-helix transcriptional regulator [Deltaproteobacteria bacterium]|nr:MAG: helix-turn-helix transcriptional regulator [Deltaproteobacteria bacterium]